MTNDDLKTELYKLGAEMCLWPPEKGQGVYIRRSEVNNQSCQWAVRIKRLIDQFMRDNQ